MTTVTLEHNRLSVIGHAGYGKVGYDIVCAGIGTLVFTLKESLELYTSDCVEFFIADCRYGSPCSCKNENFN